MEKLITRVIDSANTPIVVMLLGAIFVLASIISFLYLQLQKQNQEILKLWEKIAELNNKVGFLEGKSGTEQAIDKKLDLIIKFIT